MNAKQLIAATFAALMIVGAAAPASVAAADDEADLAIETTQSPDTGEATVVVTDNGTAVDNATLVVESDDYAGTGSYETDANGTVVLPNPANETEIQLTAVAGGNSTTAEVELTPLSESLDVDVEQADDGDATVTVTQYDAAVENASVVVNDGDENESVYAGEGSYETDANGTVDLPAPSNDTTVTVTAVSGDLTAETTVDLAAPEPAGFEVAAEETDDGAVVTVTDNESAVENATVDVEADGNYSGEGSYETDANGTVDLPGPDTNESVTLEITASQGNDTATTTLTLGDEEENASQPFGQRVSEFVHDLLGDENRTGGIGQELSEWVREHNPGKAKGPGENPGNGNGPPEHAGGNKTADGNETKAGNGNGGGPGNGNGNGGGPGNDKGKDKSDRGNGNGNGNGNALIGLPTLPF